MKHIVSFEPPNIIVVKMIGEFKKVEAEPAYKKSELKSIPAVARKSLKKRRKEPLDFGSIAVLGVQSASARGLRRD